MKSYLWTLPMGALALATPALAQDMYAAEGEELDAIIGVDVEPMFDYAGYPDLVFEWDDGAFFAWYDPWTDSSIAIEVDQFYEIVNVDVSPNWLETNDPLSSVFYVPEPH